MIVAAAASGLTYESIYARVPVPIPLLVAERAQPGHALPLPLVEVKGVAALRMSKIL